LCGISIVFVPESPEQLYERARGALRAPSVEEWDTWPFEGSVTPRELLPPIPQEPPRAGAAGKDCWACVADDGEFLWANERWRLTPPPRMDYALPVMVLLMPREHFADPGDLPDDLAAELGVLLARIERAIRTIGEIGRVHVCRYGDGSEHLHWWFIARPARLPQVKTSLITVWDDVLPPLPSELRDENLALLRAALEE
jgi:diadenosine tetraphosphate (Ap4A) HIT family hydrolase